MHNLMGAFFCCDIDYIHIQLQWQTLSHALWLWLASMRTDLLQLVEDHRLGFYGLCSYCCPLVQRKLNFCCTAILGEAKIATTKYLRPHSCMNHWTPSTAYPHKPGSPEGGNHLTHKLVIVNFQSYHLNPAHSNRVADPIVPNFRTSFKIFSWYESISCWNLVCSTYPMLATKPNFQNEQIWLVCESLRPTTNFKSSFSIYPMIAHFIAQEKKPYCCTSTSTPRSYHCTNYTQNCYFIYKNPSAPVQGKETQVCDSRVLVWKDREQQCTVMKKRCGIVGE
jgi:hypothetical protein